MQHPITIDEEKKDINVVKRTNAIVAPLLSQVKARILSFNQLSERSSTRSIKGNASREGQRLQANVPIETMTLP